LDRCGANQAFSSVPLPAARRSLAGEIGYDAGFAFGFGDLIGENTADADALLVNMEHDPRGLLKVHIEEALRAP